MESEEDMSYMIGVMSKIDDILTTVGSADLISLPQIVAIGSQSSGKSSVLENIGQVVKFIRSHVLANFFYWTFINLKKVGREVLPRSAGICTRRPLKLDLIQVDREEVVDGETHKEWATFKHLPEKVFTDWEEVRQEIIDDTEKVCGSNKGINKIPINLKIYSPNVISLTLVDLPGITRIPVGDQPAGKYQPKFNFLLKLGNPWLIYKQISKIRQQILSWSTFSGQTRLF